MEKKGFQRGESRKIQRTQVVLDDYNPRYISPANAQRLKKSLKDNGLVGTLIWNKTTGHIVGGHQRLGVLDQLMRFDPEKPDSSYEIEVTMVEMPLKDEVKLNVVLNNNDAMGEFDFTALETLSKQFGLDVEADFGFSEEVASVQFPDVVEEMLAEQGETHEMREAVATPEQIATMKEKKHESREAIKQMNEEIGDWKAEPKGILTLVFPTETSKREWLKSILNLDDTNVLHIDKFEEALMNKDFSSETSESQE